MTNPVHHEDLAAEVTPRALIGYLQSHGWTREPATWRGAEIWRPPRAEADELVVPPELQYRDDHALLLDAVRTLARAEDRVFDEVLRDITTPLVDTQLFRTHPDAPSGTSPLLSALDALEAIRTTFTLAARSVIDRQMSTSDGRHSRNVDRFLSSVRLGPSQTGSYVLSAQVPLSSPPAGEPSDDDPLERRIVLRMNHMMSAAGHAVRQAEEHNGGLDVFDAYLDRGVSARLCDALAQLGGRGRDQAFSIAFRWANGSPVDHVDDEPISFRESAPRILSRAAVRLRELEHQGTVRLRGRIIATERPAPNQDGFVKVLGVLTTGESRRRRAVRVRLSDADYRRALDAHAHGAILEAEGRLTTAGQRRELVPTEVWIEDEPAVGR